jgi:PAS domain S-box-containing protein
LPGARRTRRIRLTSVQRIAQIATEVAVAKKAVSTPAKRREGQNGAAQADGSARGALVADIIIANAPDPVFVSDLEGKILQANDAVSELLGFRRDEVVEQSLSRFISEEETREFTAALREVVERGVTRNARLNPRAATGEVIPTSLNASALRDPDGNVIGAIGVLRDMRAYEEVVRDLEQSKTELQEKILDLEKFEEVVVGRELKMIALEKELETLKRDHATLKADRTTG